MKSVIDTSSRFSASAVTLTLAFVVAAFASCEARDGAERARLAAMQPYFASEHTVVPNEFSLPRTSGLATTVPTAAIDDASTTGSPPEVQASASAAPGLAPDVVNRIIRLSGGGLRTCYADGLTRDPRLAGRVVVEMTIGRDGSVVLAQTKASDIADGAFRQCVANAAAGMSFPEPGGVVRVLYGFKFGSSVGSSTTMRPFRTRPRGGCTAKT